MSAPTAPTWTPIPLPAALTLLARHEAADHAATTERTFDRWLAAGRLPVVRLGSRVLVRASALDALVTHAATGTLPRPPASYVPDLSGARLLRFDETSHWLRISRTTLERWASPDAAAPLRIAPTRLGRRVCFRPIDVAELIDRNSYAATTGPLAGRLA